MGSGNIQKLKIANSAAHAANEMAIILANFLNSVLVNNRFMKIKTYCYSPVTVTRPDDAVLDMSGLYIHSADTGGTMNSPREIALRP